MNAFPLKANTEESVDLAEIEARELHEAFLKDVLHGLSAHPKKLSSRYFYDKKGSELFVQIMHMPEYYLMNCELEIFQKQTQALAEAVSHDESFDLVELGAGDGSKTQHLLEELVGNTSFRYIPIDISEDALDGLVSRLSDEVPGLKCGPIAGDYFRVLDQVNRNSRPKTLLFLGSNIGNFPDTEARRFLGRLAELMNPGDRLLLGADRIKSRDIVLPAYHDAAGITRDFNLNLLTRINRELGGDFQVNQFEHAPEYDEQEGIAKSSLRSTCNQTVYIKELDQHFSFTNGERIHTEISRKYDEEILNRLTKGLGLELQQTFSDSKNYFSDFLLIKH
ncbi:L-histidine N(alpha)-methyltransferase [bacterium SCSIO 12741]|nr:L-histidine N(alpha)-methyltransferase [bacterium SCSIO 12741]